jgi:restriction endonuclease S subunit
MFYRTLVDNLDLILKNSTGTALIERLFLNLAVNGKLKEISSKFESAETRKLGEICDLYQPKTISTSQLIPNGNFPVYGANGVIGNFDKFNHEDSEVLVTCRGATCGTVNVTKPFSWINGNAMVVRPKNDSLRKDFLALVLKSINYETVITGTAQPQITKAPLANVKITVPSLAAQEAVVETLNDIFQLLSEIRTKTSQLDLLRSSFRNSSIDAISTAQTPEELQNSWERIQRNWEVIAGSSQSIGNLRGLILTFAASGLLVKQDLSEKPPQFESVTSTKEIPKNWIWCELDAIASYGGNGSVNAKSIPKDGWILDLEDIEKSTSRLLLRSFGADRKTTSNKSSFNSGDVLYGKLRPYLDKVLVADMPGFCTTEIVPIRPKDGLDPNWLRICLKRPEFIKKVTELSYGTKMPRLGTNDAKTSVHPIPPLEEQRRIVERVNQLFQICDQLELDLILAKNIGDQFARSVVSA